MARRKTQELADAPVNGAEEGQTAVRETGDEPKRPPLPNPFTWMTDSIAGVEHRTARDPYQVEIKFTEGKPSEEVRQSMKDSGFQWSNDYTAWVRPIRFNSAAQDRETGRRTVAEVCKMIRAEKGVEASADVGQGPF